MLPPNTGLDASVPISQCIGGMKAAGVQFVGRYVASSTGIPGKLITPAIAVELAIAGIPLFPVYERGDHQLGGATGKADGAFSKSFLPTVGLLPNTGVVIYYAEDFNVNADNSNDMPGIVDAITAFTAALGPGYGIGCYSCGFCNAKLAAAGLITRKWLSCSSSFNGTKAAIEAGDFDMKQSVEAPITINNHTISVDLDTLRDGSVDIGARVPWGGAIPQNSPLSAAAVQMLLNKAGQTPPLATDNQSGPMTRAAIVASKQKFGVMPADPSIDWVNWVPKLCQAAGVPILGPDGAPLVS